MFFQPLHLVNVRDDLVWYKFLVFRPIRAILLLTRFIVSRLSVEQQNSEVDDVEVSDRCLESGWERPR